MSSIPAAAARSNLATEGMGHYLYILERFILPLLVVLTIVMFFGYAASRLLKRRNHDRKQPPTDSDNVDKEEGTAAFLKELTSSPPIRDPAWEHEPHMIMKKTDTPAGPDSEPSLSPAPAESPRQAIPAAAASEDLAPAAAAVLARIAKLRKAAEAKREEPSETKHVPSDDTGQQNGLGSGFEALFANTTPDDRDSAPEPPVLEDEGDGLPDALLLEDAVADRVREPGTVDSSVRAPAPAAVRAAPVTGEATGNGETAAGPAGESERLDDIIRDLASFGTPANMLEAPEADAAEAPDANPTLDEEEPFLLLNDSASDGDGAALMTEAEPGGVSAPPVAENQATHGDPDEESLIAQIVSWAAERSETAPAADDVSRGSAPAARSVDDAAEEPLVLTDAAEPLVLTEMATSSQPAPVGAPPATAISEEDTSADPIAPVEYAVDEQPSADVILQTTGSDVPAVDGESAEHVEPGDLSWEDRPGATAPAGEPFEDDPFDLDPTANRPVEDAPSQGGGTAQEAPEEDLVLNDLIAAGLLRPSTPARETEFGNVAPLMPRNETPPSSDGSAASVIGEDDGNLESLVLEAAGDSRTGSEQGAVSPVADATRDNSPPPRDGLSAPARSESDPPLIADRSRWWPDERSDPRTEPSDAVVEQLAPPREARARGVEETQESARQIAAQFDYVATVLRQSMASLSENIKATKGLSLDEIRAMQITGVDGLRDASAQLDVLGADVVRAVGEGGSILESFSRVVDHLAEMAATGALDEGWNDLVRQRISDTMYAVDRVSKQLHHALPPEQTAVDGV